MFNYTELGEQIITEIFMTLAAHYFRKAAPVIREELPQSIAKVVSLYAQIRTDFLPTPSKSHYTFNLKDLWRVYQGVCSVKPFPPDR
jgi:dynein heavy chain